MFNALCLGNLASHIVLDASRDASLLEEVDEDDIVGITSSCCQASHSYHHAILLSLAVLLVAHFALCSIIATVLAVGSCAVVGIILWFVIKRRLRIFVQNLQNLTSAAYKTNRVLLQREALSFGLGLPSTQLQRTCRLRLFFYCRDHINLLNNLAEGLVSVRDEERTRLLSTFYTEEMQELVYSPLGLESCHVTQRGIGALLDLFILHRSETLRLIVLYLNRASFITALALILRLIIFINLDLNNYISRLEVLQDVLYRQHRERSKGHPDVNESKCMSDLEKLACSLGDIAEGITNKQLSLEEVKRALQRILSNQIFSEARANISTDDACSSKVELRSQEDFNTVAKTCDISSEGNPLQDEVYEVITAPESEEYGHVECGDEGKRDVEQSRRLMDELRAALAGRATEFAARERRALANFYGVSYEEMERIEQTDAAEEADAKNEEFSSEHMSAESGNGPVPSQEEYVQPASRSLPSDLLAAIRHRSVVGEIIGDE